MEGGVPSVAVRPPSPVPSTISDPERSVPVDAVVRRTHACSPRWCPRHGRLWLHVRATICPLCGRTLAKAGSVWNGPRP